ncbi:hypothetical protein DL766_008151 [Monosporascus sp. MC13-8B]|uniref:Aminoglycoside phosphotransferase domain-containing protein n=1 Tax=Monosporascus cannonballus TaxID=155416 RepID=A0ABY0GRU3_9PEZI|nr:hypothetical protein DL762_010283 [Monosporascus cannonballus]RYP20600.1 hypothetical protein DL766_008151 [Monosporascus sp. MC13-8B]
MSAAEYPDSNSEASEGSTSPEDLSLTPQHSPSPPLGRASSVTNDGARPQDEEAVPESEQPNVPYIKTLQELYRVVDSIAGSPTTDIHRTHESAAVAATAAKAEVEYDDNNDGYDFYNIADDARDLICPACATPYDQATDSAPFRTSLRLRYNDPAGQTWVIGDRLVLTETTEDSQPEGPEVAAAEAARMLLGRLTADPVPVPAVLAAWKERGKVITIAERPRGRRLYDVWWELRPGDRECLAARVAGYVEQWRRNRSDAISSISGYRVRGHERLLGGGADDGEDGFRPCYSDAQFWSAVRDRLRRHNKIDKDAIRLLGEYMPETYPCVLTHGDLSTRNIMVEMDAEGVRVTAILGFENAASLPVWAESVYARFCYCREDEQWKALLARHLRADPLALDWWCLWTELEDETPDPERVEMLKERCRRWPKPPAERRPFNGSRNELRREPPGGERVRIPGENESSGDGGDHRREAVGPERPVFNSEPIQFSDPEATDPEDYDDDDDDKSLEDDAREDRLLGKLRESGIYDSSRKFQKQRQVNDKQKEPNEQKEDREKRPHGTEDKSRLQGKRNTWHTSRPTGAGELQSSVLEPGTATRTDTSRGDSPRDANTRPYRPIIPPGIGNLDQRSRGRTMGRTGGREFQPLGSSNKRSSMRSFDQRALQPFALLPTTGSRGRPYSSPVIPVADMERLRKVGENGKDGTVTRVLEPGKGNDAAGDETNGGVVLPTIQEQPATPQRTTVSGRARPTSLYGALHAWGQSRTRGSHGRSRSEFDLPSRAATESSYPERRALSPEPPGLWRA